MPIQQMLLGVGAVATKTYVDDVFSTYLYEGNGTSQGDAHQIVNGVDNTKGGLVWIKSRTQQVSHMWLDTERVDSNGDTYELKSDSTGAQAGPYPGYNITAFNNNGFKLEGGGGNTNENGQEYVSWNFRKAPGFFDVVTYTGNGSNRTISHSLGCIPGCYMIKRTDTAEDWKVFHRSLKGPHWYLHLNENQQQYDLSSLSNNTAPTASVFTVGTDSTVNANSGTYVCYLFAGGESTAATARSVDFDGTNDYLSIPDSSDFTVGTNYTAECWFYTDVIGSNGWDGIFGQWSGNNNAATNSWVLEYVGTALRFYYINSGGTLAFKSLVDESNGEELALKQWYHFAFVKSGSTTKLYLNGELKQSFDTTYQDGSGSFNIGGNVASGGWFNGRISNVRIVNGTAVYTSSFKPPTAPLTNITNTKLLCCNDSSQTGSTVTPGTITNNGSLASTKSPFDDPAGFIFGESGDQNVIKNGSMKLDSNGRTTVNLGFEPQWLMWKKTSGTGGWGIYDAMRGVVTGSGDQILIADGTNGESTTNNDALNFTPTGFDMYLSAHGNADFIFTAIRRSDGYVGKPPELGTSVFNIGLGQNSTTIPNYISGFPVDMGIHRLPASTSFPVLIARLMGAQYLRTDEDDAEASGAWATFDSNTGYITNQQDNTHQAWMWKRHAGFDVVAYGPGNEVEGRPIPHSLNKNPEMIWLKNRDSTDHWIVYHKGLNGGTNPEQYYLWLETTNAEDTTQVYWNSTAPTSTHFTVGNGNAVNQNNKNYIAMLFASVDGISKVGSYTGNGTSGSSTQTISTGFAPRFLIIKNTTESNNWFVLDTTRGWASGNDQLLMLDSNSAQVASNFGAPTSSGFTLTGDSGAFNENNKNYIYYAHA